MNRAEAFTQLGKVTGEKEKLQSQLNQLIEQERELYNTLGISIPTETREKRKRLTRESVLEIRSHIMTVMEDYGNKNLTWLAPNTIIRAVKKLLPDVDQDEIGQQLRALAADEDEPIQHNGNRGQGSMYSMIHTYIEPESQGPSFITMERLRQAIAGCWIDRTGPRFVCWTRAEEVQAKYDMDKPGMIWVAGEEFLIDDALIQSLID